MVHNLDVEPKRNKYKRSSTGYKGVCKYGVAGKFMASISIKGKRVHMCGFKSPKEAALAYDQAAIKAGKKKSTLNFPEELPIKEKKKESVKDGGYIVSGFIIQPYL